MGVCLVTGGKSHYSGLCVFGVQNVKTIIVVRRLIIQIVLFIYEHLHSSSTV